MFSHKTPADFMNYLRFLAAFFILSICFSCKTKEVVKPNSPPSAFTVTATLADNGKDIVLKWTKSKDPDGDAVTYAVVYKDTLAKNLSDTTYVIKDIPYGTEVKGSVVANDLKGGKTATPFSNQTATLFVKIPDINFEKALIRLKIDDVQDGQVLRSSAEKVISLDLSTKEENDKISNSTGIEAFYNLKNLSLYNNKLTNIDIGRNTVLEKFDCSFNRLTNLALPIGFNLKYLDCSVNQLKTLGVSKNLGLLEFDCSNNELTFLELSKYTILQKLNCFANQLTSLDVSNNIELKELNCAYNPISNLDISKNILLNKLICLHSGLTNLDISKNINLQYLDCSLTVIRSLDVSKNLLLTNLICESNFFKSLDISKNLVLKEFRCEFNELTNLDISKNINLEILFCSKNKIQTICVNSLNQVKPDWIKDASATYKICN